MATIDWTEPTLTTNYSLVLDRIDEKIESCAAMFNDANTNVSHPEGSIKLADVSTDKVFQRYTSSVWVNMTNTFQMAVTKLESPTGSQELGAYYLDLGNATGSLDINTVTDSAHGSRAGASLHALAQASTSNGFMSGDDKQKLDDLTDHTGQTISDLYDTYIPFPSAGEIIDGTLLTTKRYSPSRITSSISAKMQKAEALIYTSLYDVGAAVSGAVPIEAANGPYQKMVLGGITTLNFSTTGVYTLYLSIYQDTTGNRVLNLPDGYWEGGNKLSISSAANSLSIVTVHYNGTFLVYSIVRDIIRVPPL